jgi:murein tripeptide amidase MpaA
LCHEGLFTLSFEFQVPEAEDTLYFAHCFPFTWSFQQKHLTQIIEAHQGKGIIKRDLLCESLHGNRCDYLTITDFELEQVSGSDTSLRPCIFLTARVHPGETNSSWIMKGIIDHLLSDTDVAKALRARFFFVIVPMLNPDGVINGNYRCNLAGFDLNRNWKNPDPNKHRPIFATKQLIQSIQQHRKILFFCDFHGHSAKHNVFMYGCECGNGPQKLIEMVFPCIMSRIAGQLTCYVFCLSFLSLF